MVKLNVTSNEACKLGSLILAVDRGELVRVSGKILHEGKTTYVGKYSYDGQEHEIDMDILDNGEETVRVGDELRFNNIKWNK